MEVWVINGPTLNSPIVYSTAAQVYDWAREEFNFYKKKGEMNEQEYYTVKDELDKSFRDAEKVGWFSVMDFFEAERCKIIE